MQEATTPGHPPPGPKASVLLVDDQPANLLALEAMLADLGLNLVPARSGEEALRRLRDGEFALVLLDLRMPGLDGFQTATLIRGSREQANGDNHPGIRGRDQRPGGGP